MDEVRVPGTNTGHGHVWKRPDGKVYRCGGPRMCKKCAADAELVAAGKAAEQQAADDMLAHYSAALDEIYRLRCALVLEARGVEADLELATFPKSRRRWAEARIVRMRAAARGESAEAYQDEIAGATGGLRTSTRDLLIAAGASPCLTRSQWEERDRG